MINYKMFTNKRAVLNLSKSYVLAHPRCYLGNNKYVAYCFSSISDSTNKDATTPGKLSESIKSGEGDSTMEGSAGGYGGSGILGTGNNPPKPEEGAGGGYGAGSGTWASKNDTEGAGGRRREDVDMEDAARDTAVSTADMAKAGVVGTMESGLKFGEKAKETMDRMWDAAKETTENVRDAVADDGDNDDDDHRNKATDKHVEDLRRMARGYDFKDD